MRTGWYPGAKYLAPSLVGSPAFGRLFRKELPLSPGEQVVAQPLVTGTSVFVATEDNDIYALDPETGAMKAGRSVGSPWNSSDIDCGDLVPHVGITGTPVIDGRSNTAYFFSKTYRPGISGGSAGNAVWLAHAVDADTLAERAGFPVEVRGAADNDPNLEFDPHVQHQRAGLLLLDGVVYAGFGGHCDRGSYHGWVAGVTTDGRLRSLFATEAGQSGARGAGIWQSGGGLASDGSGRILFATGNGYSNSIVSPRAGSEPPDSLDESLVRLSVLADGKLQAADFFAPFNVRGLDDGDGDLGSGGPVVLPSSFGTPSHPDLAVIAGKAPTLFLVDRDDLGGFQQGAGLGDRVVSSISLPAGVWSRPAVWPGDGGFLFMVIAAGPLEALKWGVSGDGTPTFTAWGQTPELYDYTSGTPIVTSDGTRSGSALVWLTFAGGASGGMLRAFDAVPGADGSLRMRFEDSYGRHAKFSVPGVSSGRIYLGTADGAVVAYGAPLADLAVSVPGSNDSDVAGSVAAPKGPSLLARPGAVSFGALPVASARVATATIENNGTEPVELGHLGWPAPPFVVEGLPPAGTVLAPGASVVITLRFAPSLEGTFSGELTVGSGQVTAGLALTGVAAPAAALVIDSQSLDFGAVRVGSLATASFTLRNPSWVALIINKSKAPSLGVFQATTPLEEATVITGGNSRTLTVAFSPSAPGFFSDEWLISTQDGLGLRTVSFHGQGVTD